MRKAKSILALIIAVSLIFATIVSFNASASTEEYCGLDWDNFYSPNIPAVNVSPASYTTLSSYDPRSINATTPVKDQGDFGTCSLFATNAAFESAVYKETGLKNSYSEEAMRMVLSKNLYMQNDIDGVGGFYYYPNHDARNFEAAAQYLTNANTPIIYENTVEWVAPNFESDVPYTNINSNTYWPSNMGKKANAYPTGIRRIRIDQIKDAILTYGAVFKTFYSSNEVYNERTHAYFTNYDNYGEYAIVKLPNHAIAVVGWDNDYPKENFLSEHQPNEDGAWLIKNSYGTYSGEGGYMWVSYEDDSFNYTEDAAVFSQIDKVSQNEYMLSYDFLPLTLGLNSYLDENSNCKYICNVYDVSGLIDEYRSINKVTFYACNIGDFYRIYIAPVEEDGSLPDVVTLTNHCAYNSVDYEGYITEELETPYLLDSDVDKYAIIVKFITFGDSVEISQESSDNRETYLGRAKEGESYIYENGQWLDVAVDQTSVGKYSFCIRPTLVRNNPITQDSQLSSNIMCIDNIEPIEMTLNGNLLYRIWNGDKILREDIEFSRNGTTINFSDVFLEELSSQFKTTITFEFTDGNNQTLAIYPKRLSDVDIVGKAAQGQTLEVNLAYSDGTVVSAGQVSYQWQSSSDGITWNDINGERYALFTLTANERLKYVRCAVTTTGSLNSVITETIYSEPTATKVVLYGDVDMDGMIGVSDCSIIQRYDAQIIELTDEQMVAADVNGDGYADIFDISDIQRYIAGHITSFPVED